MGNLRGRGWLSWAMLIVLGLALAVAGCSSSSGGGGKKSSKDSGDGDGSGDGGDNTFGDDRTDADLLALMNDALDEAKLADSGFDSLSSLDESTAEGLALEIQAQTYYRAVIGIATGTSALSRAESADDPVSSGTASILNVDASGTCGDGVGTAEEVGSYGTIEDGDQTTEQYGIDVTSHACDDFGGAIVMWGLVRYSGEFATTVNSETSSDFGYNIGVNGGVAAKFDGAYYAVIVRDTLDYTGTDIDNSDGGSWDYNMELRVDDQTTNWVCTYTATVTSSDISGLAYDCTSSASEL